MKDFRLSTRRPSLAPLFAAVIAGFPAILLAHPGHYHPDETDEFDFFRATFFHSHGAFDYIFAAVAIVCVATAFFSTRPAVRIGAIVTAVASLALLPIL